MAKSLRFGVRRKPVSSEPREGAGDDPADPVGVADLAGDPTELVEPIQPERLLVSGDLEDAVGRGVADRLARPDVLCPETLDDRDTGGVAITEDTGEFAPFDQHLDEGSGEGRHPVGKVAPILGDGGARDLPMAGGCVLAGRGLDGMSVGPIDRTGWLEPGRDAAARPLGGETEAETRQIRQREGAGSKARAITRPGGTGFRDMAERVRPLVAVAGSVRPSADADRIEDDEKDARHGSRRVQAGTTSSVVALLRSKAAANRAFVYSVCGRAKMASAGPSSTTLPFCITST